MTNAPENIWAHPTERQPIAARLRPQARWLRGKFKDHDSKAHGDVQYTRTDLYDAVVAERDDAASLIFSAVVVERAAVAMWRLEAERAAPSAAARRTHDAFLDHDQQTRDRWIGLANAALSSADVEKTLNTQPGEDQ